MNNTIHNFSTMIDPEEESSNNIRSIKLGRPSKNQILNNGSIKLSPINNSNKYLNKHFRKH